MPLNFTILPPPAALATALRQKIDQKTKPLGALGQLEALALQIGLIQQTLTPTLNAPHIIVFAGDHGLVAAGVSLYPASVTAQMVANFINGGAAINVFARQHGIGLVIVDAGVNGDLSAYPDLIQAKIANGTQNCLTQAAMSADECHAALRKGAELVMVRHAQGCNCIGFGEMGIGNSASASLLMHRLTGLPLADCVGRGTGLDDAQLSHKTAVLQDVLARHQQSSARLPLEVLATFGGFEIAMMTGAYLQAAELGMVIMVDGFIASAALLVAAHRYPAVLDYCIFSHVSNERGHRALLQYFNATALLQLDMRLGEASGIAIAYPLLQSAVLFLNEMATFAEAGVESALSR